MNTNFSDFKSPFCKELKKFTKDYGLILEGGDLKSASWLTVVWEKIKGFFGAEDKTLDVPDKVFSFIHKHQTDVQQLKSDEIYLVIKLAQKAAIIPNTDISIISRKGEDLKSTVARIFHLTKEDFNKQKIENPKILVESKISSASSSAPDVPITEQQKKEVKKETTDVVKEDIPSKPLYFAQSDPSKPVIVNNTPKEQKEDKTADDRNAPGYKDEQTTTSDSEQDEFFQEEVSQNSPQDAPVDNKLSMPGSNFNDDSDLNPKAILSLSKLSEEGLVQQSPTQKSLLVEEKTSKKKNKALKIIDPYNGSGKTWRLSSAIYGVALLALTGVTAYLLHSHHAFNVSWYTGKPSAPTSTPTPASKISYNPTFSNRPPIPKPTPITVPKDYRTPVPFIPALVHPPAPQSPVASSIDETSASEFDNSTLSSSFSQNSFIPQPTPIPARAPSRVYHSRVPFIPVLTLSSQSNAASVITKTSAPEFDQSTLSTPPSFSQNLFDSVTAPSYQEESDSKQFVEEPRLNELVDYSDNVFDAEQIYEAEKSHSFGVLYLLGGIFLGAFYYIDGRGKAKNKLITPEPRGQVFQVTHGQAPGIINLKWQREITTSETGGQAFQDTNGKNPEVINSKDNSNLHEEPIIPEPRGQDFQVTDSQTSETINLETKPKLQREMEIIPPEPREQVFQVTYDQASETNSLGTNLKSKKKLTSKEFQKRIDGIRIFFETRLSQIENMFKRLDTFQPFFKKGFSRHEFDIFRQRVMVLKNSLLRESQLVEEMLLAIKNLTSKLQDAKQFDERKVEFNLEQKTTSNLNIKSIASIETRSQKEIGEKNLLTQQTYEFLYLKQTLKSTKLNLLRLMNRIKRISIEKQLSEDFEKFVIGKFKEPIFKCLNMFYEAAQKNGQKRKEILTNIITILTQLICDRASYVSLKSDINKLIGKLIKFRSLENKFSKITIHEVRSIFHNHSYKHEEISKLLNDCLEKNEIEVKEYLNILKEKELGVIVHEFEADLIKTLGKECTGIEHFKKALASLVMSEGEVFFNRKIKSGPRFADIFINSTLYGNDNIYLEALDILSGRLLAGSNIKVAYEFLDGIVRDQDVKLNSDDFRVLSDAFVVLNYYLNIAKDLGKITNIDFKEINQNSLKSKEELDRREKSLQRNTTFFTLENNFTPEDSEDDSPRLTCEVINDLVNIGVNLKNKLSEFNDSEFLNKDPSCLNDLLGDAETFLQNAENELESLDGVENTDDFTDEDIKQRDIRLREYLKSLTDLNDAINNQNSIKYEIKSIIFEKAIQNAVFEKDDIQQLSYHLTEVISVRNVNIQKRNRLFISLDELTEELLTHLHGLHSTISKLLSKIKMKLRSNAIENLSIEPIQFAETPETLEGKNNPLMLTS